MSIFKIRIPNSATLGWVFLFICLQWSSSTQAGSFVVSPVRATLSTSQSVSAHTLTNSGRESAMLQVEIMAWTQQDGKDVYIPSRDIIASPPIVTVPAGGSQMIRVGLRRTPDPQRELTYRMYVQEVPQPSANGFQGLQVALRIGIPVFIAPNVAQPPDLAWQIYRNAEGQLEVGLKNSGNTHVQVFNLKLARSDNTELVTQKTATYVLSGQSRNWHIKDFPVPASGTELHLFAQTNVGEIDAGLITVEQK